MRGIVRYRLFIDEEVVQFQLVPMPFDFQRRGNLKSIRLMSGKLGFSDCEAGNKPNRWEISAQTWTMLHQQFQRVGFRVIGEDEAFAYWNKSRFAREGGMISVLATLWLLVELLGLLIGHLTQSTSVHHRHVLNEAAINIRIYFSLASVLNGYLFARFGNRSLLLFTAVVFCFVNPLWPYYLSSWWAWFLLYLLLALIMGITGVSTLSAGQAEHNDDSWWHWRKLGILGA